ncbi:hypothetical protein CTI14_23300 [Methylobacterium radiotolerans]|nr:hypothetical protein CTI14_23300 [Methylobacterium radiotolerans]
MTSIPQRPPTGTTYRASSVTARQGDPPSPVAAWQVGDAAQIKFTVPRAFNVVTVVAVVEIRRV